MLHLNTNVERPPPSPPLMDHPSYSYEVQAARAQLCHRDSSMHGFVKMEFLEVLLPHGPDSISSSTATVTPENQIYTHVSMLRRAPGALNAEGGSRSTLRMSDFTSPESPSTYTPRFVDSESQPCTDSRGHSAPSRLAIDSAGSVTCDDGYGCGTAAKKMKEPFLACFFCRGRKIACGPAVPGSADKTCK